MINDQCMICYDTINMKKLVCNHIICKECFKKYIEYGKKNNKDYTICPICRQDISYNTGKIKLKYKIIIEELSVLDIENYISL